MERAAEEKRKQARKIGQKAKGASKKKSTEGGGRLAHQKSIGSKEKKMHNAAKSLEHRIAALGSVEAPEDIRRIRFRQSKALELTIHILLSVRKLIKYLEIKYCLKMYLFKFRLAQKWH